MKLFSVLTAALCCSLVLCVSASAKTAPKPVFSKAVVVAKAGGTVTVKAAGKKKFVKLSGKAKLAVGSLIDATKGSVKITSALPVKPAKTQVVTVSKGVFKISQSKGGGGETGFSLVVPGHSCAAPPAETTLKVVGLGKFAIVGCDSKIQQLEKAPPGAAVAAAGKASAAAAPPSVQVWEYPGGRWQVSTTATHWVFAVTNLLTGTTTYVDKAYVYEYIVTNGPPTGSTLTNGIDPQGDQIACAPCNLDLKSASLTDTGGQVTVDVENYGPWPALAGLYPLHVQLYTSKPSTVLYGDFRVESNVTNTYVTPYGSITDTYTGPPLTFPTPTTARLTFPDSAFGSPAVFRWAVDSGVCGIEDRLPDAGTIEFPSGATGKSAKQSAQVKC